MQSIPEARNTQTTVRAQNETLLCQTQFEIPSKHQRSQRCTHLTYLTPQLFKQELYLASLQKCKMSTALQQNMQ